jgi:hypothetical protein
LYERMKALGPNVPDLIILPIYSALPSEMQSRIFEFREVDLHHGDERRVEVVRFGLLRVKDLDGERATGIET